MPKSLRNLLIVLAVAGAGFLTWYLVRDKPEAVSPEQAKIDRLKDAEKPQQDSIVVYRQRWKDARAEAAKERQARIELKAQHATIKKKYEALLNRPPLHPDTLAFKLSTYESLFEQ